MGCAGRAACGLLLADGLRRCLPNRGQALDGVFGCVCRQAFLDHVLCHCAHHRIDNAAALHGAGCCTYHCSQPSQASGHVYPALLAPFAKESLHHSPCVCWSHCACGGTSHGGSVHAPQRPAKLDRRPRSQARHLRLHWSTQRHGGGCPSAVRHVARQGLGCRRHTPAWCVVCPSEEGLVSWCGGIGGEMVSCWRGGVGLAECVLLNAD